MNFWEKLQKIDRRIIYVVLAVFTIFPFFLRMGLPVPITKEVKDVFDYIEKLGPENCVLISADYDPSVSAELNPMFDAIIRQCFARKVKVLAMSLFPQGPGVMQPIIDEAARDFKAESGIDYCFLGYRYGYTMIVISMGQGIHETFVTDYYGTALRDMPVMSNIRDYKDVDILIPITGSAFAQWIVYAHEPFQVDMAAGVTAVMAADEYPYLQGGQILGLLGGLKGAAEYESLNNTTYGMPPRMATIGMESQSWAHIIMIIFIIIGNIAFFKTKGKKQ
jgi:hypothetical protein